MQLYLVAILVKYVSRGNTFLRHADSGQYLLGKGNDQTAEEAQEALGPLAGVMALDAHAHLYHTPAEDDDAHCLDAGENKVTQVIHNGQGIAVGVGRAGKQRQAKDENTPQAQDTPCRLFSIAFLQIVPPFQVKIVYASCRTCSEGCADRVQRRRPR